MLERFKKLRLIYFTTLKMTTNFEIFWLVKLFNIFKKIIKHKIKIKKHILSNFRYKIDFFKDLLSYSKITLFGGITYLISIFFRGYAYKLKYKKSINFKIKRLILNYATDYCKCNCFL